MKPKSSVCHKDSKTPSLHSTQPGGAWAGQSWVWSSLSSLWSTERWRQMLAGTSTPLQRGHLLSKAALPIRLLAVRNKGIMPYKTYVPRKCKEGKPRVRSPCKSGDRGQGAGGCFFLFPSSESLYWPANFTWSTDTQARHVPFTTTEYPKTGMFIRWARSPYRRHFRRKDGFDPGRASTNKDAYPCTF